MRGSYLVWNFMLLDATVGSTGGERWEWSERGWGRRGPGDGVKGEETECKRMKKQKQGLSLQPGALLYSTKLYA